MPALAIGYWLCPVIGLFCAGVVAPNASIIQSAYDREAANGSKLHDKNLRIINADCDALKEGCYLCQITFLSNDDPSKRLYFDVIAVAGSDATWELKSGLCKR